MELKADAAICKALAFCSEFPFEVAQALILESRCGILRCALLPIDIPNTKVKILTIR
jgi:hypothetical protein